MIQSVVTPVRTNSTGTAAGTASPAGMEAEMPKITVVTEGGTYTFENDSVENVAALVEQTGEALGIAKGANIAVNGRPATAETPLADGDEVSTTKPAGRKGV